MKHKECHFRRSLKSKVMCKSYKKSKVKIFILFNVVVPSLVTYFNWTSIVEWYVVGVASRTNTKKTYV